MNKPVAGSADHSGLPAATVISFVYERCCARPETLSSGRWRKPVCRIKTHLPRAVVYKAGKRCTAERPACTFVYKRYLRRAFRAGFCSATGFREHDAEHDAPDRQRPDPRCRCRARHRIALCAAQRPRIERTEIWLRARRMRRLRRADRRRSGAFLRDPDRRLRRARHRDARRPRLARRIPIPCSKPSSPNRPRNAATASTA